MAVYSMGMSGEKYKTLEVTRRFKVFDTVTIYLREGKLINGEIVFIGDDEVYVTGPYMPIHEIKFKDITDVTQWNAPADWK